jgi:hypothetical protein
MGQIIGGAAKPKRCNINQLSQLETPAAGEYILVSSDNSMNAAGQGNFDAYVVGDGKTAATALKLNLIDGTLQEEVSQLGQKVGDTSGYNFTGYKNANPTLIAGKFFTYSGLAEASSANYQYTSIPVNPGEKYYIVGYNINSNVPAAFVYKYGTTTKAIGIGQSAAGRMTGEYTIPEGYDTLIVNGQKAQAPVIVLKYGSYLGSAMDAVNELREELLGNIILEDYYQGNTTNGLFFGSELRVTNLLPINIGRNFKVVCSGDVKAVGVTKYAASKSPMDASLTSSDYSYSGISGAGTNVEIAYDSSFPNIYVTFAKASNTSSAITPSEVAPYVSVIDLGAKEASQDNSIQAVDSRVTAMASGISNILYETTNKTILSKVKELYLLNLDSSKTYYFTVIYTSSKALLRLFDGNNTQVATYNGAVLNGVVRLTQNGTSRIHGWAVIDVKTTDTTLLTSGNINKDLCGNIGYSPSIASYLGENLWGLGDASTYINESGELVQNATFQLSDYIPILKKDIHLYQVCGGNSSAYCALAFYTKEKTFIEVYDINGGATVDLTLASGSIPEICEYIRVNALTAEAPFVSMTNNEKDILALTKQEGQDAISFNSLHGSGSLLQNEYLLLNKVHIHKNILFSARINGTIESVSIGNGYLEEVSEAHPNHRGYGAIWVTITPTQILLYGNYSTSETLLNTYTHGLTLGTETTVSIVSKLENGSLSVNILLSDGAGHLYKHTLQNWGLGQPFAQNLGTSDITVDMRFMPCDIYNPIWLFGDSYLGFNTDNRWPYYAVNNGFKHYLLNARPGESPDEGWVDLQNLINAGGRPKTLCWCLGMNGGGVEQVVDGQYVINQYQKTYIDNVKALCETLGIVPVFATIPTVPSQQKTGLSNYVRNLGCRYIDFANAVGAQSNGTWKTGMLSEDEVHPSTLGAEALASRAFADFPEIAEGI